MELQFNEVVDVIVGLAVLPLFLAMTRRLANPGVRNWLVVGYVMLLVSDVVTIIEGALSGMMGEWFNLAEHVSLFLMGICFLVAAIRTRAGIIAARRSA